MHRGFQVQFYSPGPVQEIVGNATVYGVPIEWMFEFFKTILELKLCWTEGGIQLQEAFFLIFILDKT